MKIRNGEIKQEAQTHRCTPSEHCHICLCLSDLRVHAQTHSGKSFSFVEPGHGVGASQNSDR